MSSYFRIAVLSTALLAACGDQPVQKQPVSWFSGEVEFLRSQVDASRERRWILTEAGVIAYDYRTGQRTGPIPLPGWVMADEAFSCAPDLAIGPNGEAVVTSNILPEMWRIDPVNFSVAMHQPALNAEADKDVGFTGLVYSTEQQTFFAASGTGSLWRIDPKLRGARRVALSGQILGACGLTIRKTVNRFLGLCIQGERRDWTVNLTPDRQSAYLIERPCEPEATGQWAKQPVKSLPASLIGG